jgi:hypothetical protein
MKISRCRYWQCPGCQALHGKKDLSDLLRRQRGGEEVSVAGKYRCPECGAVSSAADVYAGAYDLPRELWDRLPGPAEVPIEKGPAPGRRDGRITAAPDDRGEAEWAILDEEAEEEDRRKRRRYAVRRRGLNSVNTGLAFHYGGMVGFLLGAVAGWVGLAVFLVTAVRQGAAGEDEPVPVGPLAAMTFLFLAGWWLTAMSSVADVVSSAFCLSVPDTLARRFLIGSLVVRALAAPSGLLFLLVGWAGTAVLATGFLAVVGWLLWVAFLWGLAGCLNHPDLGEEAVGVTLSAFTLVLGWVVVTALLLAFLVFILLLARVAGPYACFAPFSFAALIAGIIKYLLASGKFDSLVTLLLYPTGIPVITRYLDLIGTTRMIILRRS